MAPDAIRVSTALVLAVPLPLDAAAWDAASEALAAGDLCAYAELATAMYLLPPEEADAVRSAEHTSELQSLMRTSYAVFCLKKQKTPPRTYNPQYNHSPT